MGDRCTGHCCRKFYLPLLPEQLARAAILRVARPHYKPEEIRKVAAMAVYLGEHDKHGLHVYTCRHLNVISGDCTVYEDRPDVCRDFPYGDVCMHAASGCTWDAACEGTAGTRFRLPEPVDTEPVPPAGELIPAEHLTAKAREEAT